MFSIGERSGLQAGQFSSQTLLLRSHAVVIVAVCGFALSCWNTQGFPWNIRHLEGSICCSKTFIYLSAFIVPSKSCKLPIPYALMHLQGGHGGLGVSDFQQECQIRTRLTIEHFSTLKQSILNEPWPTGHDGAFWTMFTYGFLFAW